MVATARRELDAAGVTEKPGVVLADAGYWKNDAIEAIVAQGIQTLVAPDADRRKEPRPGRRGGLYDFTRRVLSTDSGKQLYLKRQGTIEPVFGQIKANRQAARAWVELGNMLVEAGDPATAVEAFRRAAAAVNLGTPPSDAINLRLPAK